MHVQQAVFLVGGKGTRLGAITAQTPKPMLDIGDGLSMLDVLIEQAARHGFAKVLLLAGHFGEAIEARHDGTRVHGADVRVVRELEPAGTGGALVNAREHLDPWFVLANGDTFFDANLRLLTVGAGPDADFLARLALREVPDISRYGSVRLEGDTITSFGEKVEGRSGPGLISAGTYLINRQILDYVTLPASIETDVFAKLAPMGRLKGVKLDGYFLDIGIPEALEQGRREIPDLRRRPAAFLDRDGVLNTNVGWAHRADQLEWIAGAKAAVRHLNDSGYYVIVVTNQAGVARGLYSEEQMHAFHAHLQSELADVGAHVDAFYHCPFHPEAVTETYRAADHPDRKPNPGMLLQAMRDWPIDKERSFLIGDSDSDVIAAQRAGVPGHLFAGGSLLDATKTAMGTAASDDDLTEKVETWLFKRALPFWRTHGVDRKFGGFIDHLALGGGDANVGFKRTRVLARQVYVFSHASVLGVEGAKDIAQSGFDFVASHAWLGEGGGWARRLSAAGEVIDATPDLYDLAFMLFATGWLHRATGTQDSRNWSHRTLAFIDTHLRHANGIGFLAEKPETGPRLQNPHMHLLEAALCNLEATGDAPFRKIADELVALFVERLFDAETGTLREYFDDEMRPLPGDQGLITEPGHQYEWAWILAWYQRLTGRDMTAYVTPLVAFAERHGVDAKSGATFDLVRADGFVLDRGERLWPQAERIQAACAMYELTGQDPSTVFAESVGRLFAKHLAGEPEGTWLDHFDAAGVMKVDKIPASSLYHIMISFTELLRIQSLMRSG